MDHHFHLIVFFSYYSRELVLESTRVNATVVKVVEEVDPDVDGM
ncbi:Uncharacterised protein [Chlamydia trachomatis]|nr:Uncharacterised protein [Chlamydia trachomatis]